MKADPPASFSRGDDLIDFPEIARTIGRYKWGIVGITLLAAALAALAAFAATPIYRGTVAVLIELRPQRVVQIQDVYDPGTGLSEYYWTQSMVLRSRSLAERVVDRLNLIEHPEFAPADPEASWAHRLDLRRWLPLPEVPAPAETADPEQRRSDVVDALISRITVEPLAYTQIIKVHFDAEDPELAAAVPNALAELYIESGLEAKLEATSRATQWLVEKLGDIQGKLAASEVALQTFLEQESLVNVGGARTLTEEQLVDYSRRLREAQKKRSDYQAAHERIRAAGNDPRRLRDISSLFVSDPMIERAAQSYLSAQEAVKQLAERYGERHPQMATARARLATAESAFNQQLRIAAQGLRTEYELAQESERLLQSQVDAARAQIQQLDRKNFELSSLQRDVTANRDLYDTFLTRFKETDTTSGYEALLARILDRAVVPKHAHAPAKKRWVVIGAMAGFLASLVLALLHYVLNEGVRTAEELEGEMQLPVFGVLPLISGFAGKRNIPMLYLEKPRTPLAEGVRSIRAALMLNDTGERQKRLMVTSAVPSEGKSSVCASLALALAASERVLLIETDLRKPSLRRHFKLPRGTPGLTEVLSGAASLSDSLYAHPEGNITLLHAGRIPPNPGELLASEAFKTLLDTLDGQYDRILLDSPPCQAAADALMLARQVQGVLFVVKSESTTRRAIKSSLKQLRYAGAPLTGLVVNQVDTRRNSSYAQGYYYAYNYYR